MGAAQAARPVAVATVKAANQRAICDVRIVRDLIGIKWKLSADAWEKAYATVPRIPQHACRPKGVPHRAFQTNWRVCPVVTEASRLRHRVRHAIAQTCCGCVPSC